MKNLDGKRIAVIAGDGFEERELTEPVAALREAGAAVDIISEKRGPIQGFRHHDKSIEIGADRSLEEASPDVYDALVLPGGALNADAMRGNERAQHFVRAMDEAGRPMAVICHAPWLLVSAGIAKDRTLTSWPAIADDLRNAGARWVDREVVIDENLVTSRGPNDLPAFNRAMIEIVGRAEHAVR